MDIGLIPVFEGQTTDHDLKKVLSNHYPLCFRKGQDLVVAVKKFIHRSGFFTTDEKRMLNVQTEYSGLVHALQMEGFGVEGYDGDNEIVLFAAFMQLFSNTFPNWQNEYLMINELFIAPVLDIIESETAPPDPVDEISDEQRAYLDNSLKLMQTSEDLITEIQAHLWDYLRGKSESDSMSLPINTDDIRLTSCATAIIQFYLMIQEHWNENQESMVMGLGHYMGARLFTTYGENYEATKDEEKANAFVQTVDDCFQFLQNEIPGDLRDGEDPIKRQIEHLAGHLRCECLGLDYEKEVLGEPQPWGGRFKPFDAFVTAAAIRVQESFDTKKRMLTGLLDMIEHKPNSPEDPFENGDTIVEEQDEKKDNFTYEEEEDEIGFIDGFDGDALKDWALFSKQMSDLTHLLVDDLVQYVRDRSGRPFNDDYHFMTAGAVSIMTGFLWVLSEKEQEEKNRHINIYRDATMALLKSKNEWSDEQADQVLENSDGFTRFLMDDIACFNTMSDSSLQDLIRSQIRMLYCECEGINYHDAMFNLNLLPKSDADLRHTLFAMGLYGQVRNEVAPMMAKML